MKPTTPSTRDRLRAQLADLKMPGALEALDDILRQLDGGTLTAPAALEAVLGAQISLRNNRRLVAAMRSSRLPAVKTLADFDFSFQPALKREQIDHLHTLGFLERRENVVLLGPPGVGKTHLAISLANRLVHHCHIVNIRGNSYRMRHHTELYAMLHGREATPAPPARRRGRAREDATT